MSAAQVKNNLAADVTILVAFPSSGCLAEKTRAGQTATFDLNQAQGWEGGDTISISVHADGGLTRGNNTETYEIDRNHKYTIDGFLDDFTVSGPY